MKNIKKCIAVVIAFIMVISILPIYTQAATIKLNKTKTTIYVGKTTTLKLIGTSKKVKWKSSKKSVAVVTSKGKVTGKKAGNATITASLGKKSYKCKVTVKNPYLSKTKLTLTEGKTYTLKIYGTTAKTWSSSNKKIATVSSKGKIYAKKAGTATIYCKAKNNKTYKCKITVKNKTIQHVCDWNKEVVQPTCVEKGYTIYKCKGCGKSYIDNYTEPMGHDFSIEVIEQKATCSSNGSKHYKCSRCADLTSSQTIPKLEHQYVINKIVDPTCEEKGYTEYKCSLCNNTKKEDITEALGHDYEKSVIPASKEKKGYTLCQCRRCSYQYRENYTDFQPVASQVYEDIIAMKSQYPEGMTWTNDNYYEGNGGAYSGGYGCAGFASMLSDAAFGYLPAKRHTDFSDIKVGDVLRINDNTHSVIVLTVDNEQITVAEGNYNKSVHWGRAFTRSYLETIGTYVLTRYPQ